MKVYIINNLTEASLLFNTIESAQTFAKKYGFETVAVYYIDKHIGYGVTNEKKLLGTKDFTWV